MDDSVYSLAWCQQQLRLLKKRIEKVFYSLNTDNENCASQTFFFNLLAEYNDLTSMEDRIIAQYDETFPKGVKEWKPKKVSSLELDLSLISQGEK